MTQAILLVFTALLVIAAVGDWRRYLIPNWISLALLALYPLFALSSNLLGPPAAAVPWLASLLVASIAFILLAGLFALNKLGGGDVKLISALALWAGPGLIAGFLIVTSLAGGVLSLITLARAWLQRRRQSPTLTSKEEGSVTQSGDSDNDAAEDTKALAQPIPYGVAIACGGFFISGKHIINHFSQ